MAPTDLPEPLVPADEGRHPADLDDRLWNESWYLDWAAADASLGGYLRWSLYPGLGVSWFWACVVGADRPLVTALNHEVPLPDDATTTTVQVEGLRAELRFDEPFERCSVAFETTATRHHDPAGVFGASVGEPATLAGELTWETAGGAYPYPGVTRYEVPCLVHGTVHVDGEGHRVETHGQRDHSWGHRDWWSFGWVWTAGCLDDGTAFHATQVRIPGVDYTPGFLVPPRAPLQGIDGFAAAEELDGRGLPASATFGLHDLSLAVVPVAHAPVPLPAPDAGEPPGRLARALCRFEAHDGRQGTGWVEWNQPPTAAG